MFKKIGSEIVFKGILYQAWRHQVNIIISKIVIFAVNIAKI